MADSRAVFGEVYPRVCGGTVMELLALVALPGLSPRVRGNRRRHRRSVRPAGSIPACAGEPSGVGIGVRCDTVYPRVCGGTVVGRFRLPALGGLSPRVRGNRGVAAVGDVVRGSIPACAGEPGPAGWAIWPRGVYPRVCGGTIMI